MKRPVTPTVGPFSAAIQRRQEELAGKPLVPAAPEVAQYRGADGQTIRVTLGTSYSPLSAYGDDAPVGYDALPSSPQETPNYDRLSSSERWIMSRLPGFSESSVGQALSWFGGTWGGRVLQYLDVGAETLERTLGLVGQWAASRGDPETERRFSEQLAEAWYAGSLTADVANMPEIGYGLRGAGIGAGVGGFVGLLGGPGGALAGTLAGGLVGGAAGEIYGLMVGVPQDLPGIAGLVEARQQIAALVDQGMTPRAALTQVRDTLYQTEGALALRMQLNDMQMHVFGDPINALFPFIRPIERSAVARILAEGARGMPADIALGTARTTEAIAETERVLRIADEAGDTAEVARLGEQLGLQQATLTRVQQVVEMSWWEQKLLQWTGVVPWGEETAFQRTATRISRSRLNPFALTPQAMGHEYVTQVVDNLEAHVIGESGDPVLIATRIRAAADACISPELGHMLVTPQGRLLRANLGEIAAHSDDLLRARDLTTFQRGVLDFVSSNLGETAARTMERIGSGEGEAIFRQLADLFGTNPEAVRALETVMRGGGLTTEDFTADLLGRVHGILDGTPYTDDLFRFYLHNAAIDVAAHNAIGTFGIRARGFFTQLSQTMKSAETLVFLRMNPAYPIRNWINNTFTTIGRGAQGGLSMREMTELWRNLDILPSRLREGIGMGGVATEVTTGAVGEANNIGRAIMREVEEGTTGWMQRVQQFIGRANLGRADMAQLAGVIERRASMRAFTTGYLRLYPQAMRAYLPTVADMEPALAQALGEGPAEALRQAIVGARTPAELDALAFSENLNLTTRRFLDGAGRAVGDEIDNIIDPAFTARWGPELEGAAQRGPSAIRDTVAAMRTDMEVELARGADDALQGIRMETAARVQTEGTRGVVDVFCDAHDDLLGTMDRHAVDMANLDAAVHSADRTIADRAWRAVEDANTRFYDRTWNRMEALYQGTSDGLDGVVRDLRTSGRLTPELREGLTAARGQLTTSFRRWRGTWRDFFEYRSTTLGGYFDALREGETPSRSWETIVTDLNGRYERAITGEGRYLRELDELAAGMLPEAERETFLAGRQRIAAFREQDHLDVVALRGELDEAREAGTLAPEAVQARYVRHWNERRTTWSRMAQENNLARAANAGDPQATAVLDADTARRLGEQVRRPGVTVPRGAEQIAAEAGVVTEAQRTAAAAVDAEVLQRAVRAGWITQAEVDMAQQAGREGERLFVQRGGWIRWGTEVAADGTEVPVLSYIRGRGAGGGRDTLTEWLGERMRAGQNLFGTNEQTIGAELAAGELPEAGARGGRGFFETMTEEGRIRLAQEYQTPMGEARFLYRIGPGGDAATALPHLRDYQSVVPRELWMSTGVDQLWFTRGREAVDAIERSMIDAAAEPPLRFADLSPELQTAMRRYIAGAHGAMGDARYAGIRGGEWFRDSALLNYNRRFNYNAWLGVIFPYEFWMTQSAWKWALHSIDRPAMLSTYLRMRQFLDTAYRPESNLPQRLRGRVRISLPFLPDWMGSDIFVDPLQSALPFDQFGRWYDQASQQDARDEGSAARKLEELLNDGQITQADYDEANTTHAGATWARALALAQQDDAEGRLSAFDLMSVFTSAHAPIMWAYNAARGTPERIGPFMPITRSIRGVTAALGIGPAGGVNIEGSVRKALGLPEFDQWDDYRVDRMLVNMVANGVITLEESRRAMVERRGPIFEEARRRQGLEFAVGALGSMLGIPSGAYPTGEEHLRELRDEYSAAWDAYNGGDLQAIRRFEDEHPEYQARVDLGYWNKPEERLQRFLIDELWSRWNEMPDLTRDEVQDQLGTLFQTAFLSRETRSYAAIPLDTLSAWVRVMGGDPPGTLTPGEGQTVPPLDLATPDIANRAQVFYDTRDMMFRDWYTTQSDYFQLDEGAARQAYRRAHPILEQYWTWRNDWLLRNPDVIPYLVDDPEARPTYPSEEALRAGQAGQPAFTWDEWRIALGPSLSALIVDYGYGEELPAAAQDRIREVAEGLGITYEDALQRIVSSTGLATQQ